MLSLRNVVLATLAVAGACGFGAYAIAATNDRTGEGSNPQSLEPSLVSSQEKTDAALARMQVEEGPKPRAFSRPSRATDAPLARIPHLANDARRIATARSSGIDHSVYIGKNSKDGTCLVLQEGSSGRGGGGCNPSRNPLLGSTVLWSSAQYNEDPQRLVVFGVVHAKVAALSLVFDGGAQTAVPLSDDDGFVQVITKPVIEATDVPTSIITFDSNGREIERTELGITFGP